MSTHYEMEESDVNKLIETANMLNVLRTSMISVVSLEIYDADEVACLLSFAIRNINQACGVPFDNS